MSIEGWAVVELLGHRTRAGRISEQEIAGTSFVRIDVPVEDKEDEFVTEYYGGGAIYSICPAAEEIIRDQHYGKRLPASPMRYAPPAALADLTDADAEVSQDPHGSRFDNRDPQPIDF